MAQLQVTLDIKEDGQTLAGFPLTTTVTAAESRGRSAFIRPSLVGSYVELPLEELGDISVLFVQSTEEVELRFNDQTVGGLPLNATGYVLIVNGAIPSTASDKASVLNASGANATITQVAAGT